MTIFDTLPGKQIKQFDSEFTLFSDLPQSCAVNQFFMRFSSSSGWLGRTYFTIWSEKEVLRFRQSQTSETCYSSDFYFFGSNGSSELFGVTFSDGEQYFSAPSIGADADVFLIGEWDFFLKSLSEGSWLQK